MQKNKRFYKSKKILFSFVFVLFLLMIIKIYNNVEIFSAKSCVKIKEHIGIIDTYLSKEYENVEYYTLSKIDNTSKNKTHGDFMVDFVRSTGYSGKIYYCSALKNGKINSDSIYDALECLKKQGVKKINISLSSKVMDEKIQNWIQDNNNFIQVYASYNNRLNTLSDYPAMYKNVIGSGFDERIKYKDCDRKYKSNKLIVISSSISFRTGNSYLSLVSMLKDCVADME